MGAAENTEVGCGGRFKREVANQVQSRYERRAQCRGATHHDMLLVLQAAVVMGVEAATEPNLGRRTYHTAPMAALPSVAEHAGGAHHVPISDPSRRAFRAPHGAAHAAGCGALATRSWARGSRAVPAGLNGM